MHSIITKEAMQDPKVQKKHKQGIHTWFKDVYSTLSNEEKKIRSLKSAISRTGLKRGTYKNRGEQAVTYTCPHCNKVGGGNSMKRWHFDNCRWKNGG
jgi:hypothetical protein